MYAYRLETVISKNGELQIHSLPFRAGKPIEVIILAANQVYNRPSDFPLKGTVLKYEEPTEPIADQDDWDVLQ